MSTQAISLIGLGKLGLPFAACMADAGFDVLGVDIMQHVVDAVNEGRCPLQEPGMEELVSRVGGKSLKATSDHERAIAETDVTIILTATNPVGPLNYGTYLSGGFHRRQLIGYSINDSYRFREMVAEVLNARVSQAPSRMPQK